MSECLRYLASSECITQQEKFNFLKNVKKPMDNLHLCFLVVQHWVYFIQVYVKALLEQDLMPRVLSGSSAGAIMTGMLGVPRLIKFQNCSKVNIFLVMLLNSGKFQS
jgi:NTE family protein